MSTDIPQDFSPVITVVAEVTPDDESKNEPGHVSNLAERRAKLIPIAQIAAPKKDKWSYFNKKAAEELADTIRGVGLMHPILLRPTPKSPTKVTGDGTLYEVVAGRQRLYACHNILKWDEIPAIVAAMDDQDCEMYEIIENCARKTLKPDQLYAHVAAWRKIHAAKVGAPDPKDLRKGRKEAADKARMFRHAKDAADDTGDAKAASEVLEAPEPNIQEMVAHATGTSVRTAVRTMRVSAMLEGLTDEEKAIIFPDDENKHPTGQQLEEMTRLNESGVQTVLKLVASGMPWSEAIPMGSKKPGRKPNPDKPVSIDDLSLDDWLMTTCTDRSDPGDKLGIYSTVSHKSRFRNEAGLYREFVKFRKKIQADVESLLIASKKAGHRGPFQEIIEKAFRVKFPSEWMLCGLCGGKGKSVINGEEGPTCNQCRGAGYRVSHEAL